MDNQFNNNNPHQHHQPTTQQQQQQQQQIQQQNITIDIQKLIKNINYLKISDQQKQQLFTQITNCKDNKKIQQIINYIKNNYNCNSHQISSILNSNSISTSNSNTSSNYKNIFSNHIIMNKNNMKKPYTQDYIQLLPQQLLPMLSQQQRIIQIPYGMAIPFQIYSCGVKYFTSTPYGFIQLVYPQSYMNPFRLPYYSMTNYTNYVIIPKGNTSNLIVKLSPTYKGDRNIMNLLQ